MQNLASFGLALVLGYTLGLRIICTVYIVSLQANFAFCYGALRWPQKMFKYTLEFEGERMSQKEPCFEGGQSVNNFLGGFYTNIKSTIIFLNCMSMY